MRSRLLPSINELPRGKHGHVRFTIRKLWILSGLGNGQKTLPLRKIGWDPAPKSRASAPQLLCPGALSLAQWVTWVMEPICFATWLHLEKGSLEDTTKTGLPHGRGTQLRGTSNWLVKSESFQAFCDEPFTTYPRVENALTYYSPSSGDYQLSTDLDFEMNPGLDIILFF